MKQMILLDYQLHFKLRRKNGVQTVLKMSDYSDKIIR